MKENNQHITKEQIDLWINANYKELKTILAGMSAKKNLVKFTSDLFSNSYIYVCSKPWMNEFELRVAFIQYAKMQLEWSNSEFKKEIFGTEEVLGDIQYDEQEEESFSDEDMLEQIDWQNMVGAIELYRQSLIKLRDKKLFEIYFEKKKNTKTKLAQHMGWSESNAAKHINKLRTKIIKIYQENGGQIGYKPKKDHRIKNK